MSVFEARDNATKQPAPLFKIALRQFLCITQSPESLSDDIAEEFVL